MARFTPCVGSLSLAKTSPTIDGQFIVATDSREIFFDNNSMRIQLNDIVFLTTEGEREEIFAPLQKFYFVTSTGKLYLWDGSCWIVINSNPMDENSIPPAGSPTTLLYAKDGKIKPLPLGQNGEVLTVLNGNLAWMSIDKNYE
jgi:hypothetical protein